MEVKVKGGGKKYCVVSYATPRIEAVQQKKRPGVLRLAQAIKEEGLPIAVRVTKLPDIIVWEYDRDRRCLTGRRPTGRARNQDLVACGWRIVRNGSLGLVASEFLRRDNDTSREWEDLYNQFRNSICGHLERGHLGLGLSLIPSMLPKEEHTALVEWRARRTFHGRPMGTAWLNRQSTLHPSIIQAA